jgi:predicted TIM-barrel fold metal-dependent hydrolase
MADGKLSVPPIIDSHSHLYSQSYMDLLRSRTALPRIDDRAGSSYFVIFPEEERNGGRLMEAPMWSLEEKLAAMDRGGFERSVVSLGNPWLDPIEGAESVDWAHRINAEFASFEARSGGRIHGLGVLPNARPEAAAEIVRELADTDGLYGVISGCRICGLTFDAPELEPVWDALSATGLPIFVHPHYAVAIDQLGGFGTILPLGIGFPIETSIAVARLILSGGLERHPGIRLLVAHAGGVLPYLAARLDVSWRGDEEAKKLLTVAPSEALSGVWLDSVVYHRRGLRAAEDLVGKDRILFGTDHPFFKDRPKDIYATVAEAFADDPSLLDAISGRNAISFFGLPDN